MSLAINKIKALDGTSNELDLSTMKLKKAGAEVEFDSIQDMTVNGITVGNATSKGIITETNAGSKGLITETNADAKGIITETNAGAKGIITATTLASDDNDALSRPSGLNSSVTPSGFIDRLITLSELTTKTPISVDMSPQANTFFDKPIYSSNFTVYPLKQFDYQNGTIKPFDQYPFSMFTSSFNRSRVTYFYSSVDNDGVPQSDDSGDVFKDYSRDAIDVTLCKPNGYKYAARDGIFFDSFSPDINYNNGQDGNDIATDFPTFEWQMRITKERDISYYDERCKKISDGGALIQPLSAHVVDLESMKVFSRLGMLQGTEHNDELENSERDWDREGEGFFWYGNYYSTSQDSAYFSQAVRNDFGAPFVDTTFKYDGLVKMGVLSDGFKRNCNVSVGLPVALDLGSGVALVDMEEFSQPQLEDDFDYKDHEHVKFFLHFVMSKASDEAQVDKDVNNISYRNINYTNTCEVRTTKIYNDTDFRGETLVSTKHIFNHVDWARSTCALAMGYTTTDEIYFVMAPIFALLGLIIDGEVSTLEDYLETFTDDTFYGGHYGKEYSSMDVVEKISHLFKVFLMATLIGDVVNNKIGEKTWASMGIWYALNHGRRQPTSEEASGIISFGNRFNPTTDSSGNSEFYQENQLLSSDATSDYAVGGKYYQHSITTRFEDYATDTMQQSQEFNPIDITAHLFGIGSSVSLTNIQWQQSEKMMINTNYYSLKDQYNHGLKDAASIITDRLTLLTGSTGNDFGEVVPPQKFVSFRQKINMEKFNKNIQMH